MILSVNRFERKKNIALAIDAFALLRKTCTQEFPNLRLVIAGTFFHYFTLAVRVKLTAKLFLFIRRLRFTC